MKQNITRKIIAQHLLSGEMVAGEEISIRIDHTLTHDVTGTPAYLAFETLGIAKVKTERSVSYIDHNMLYTDNKNPDDHIYLQTVAKKHGIYLSKAGNGICHTVHFERFSRPGITLLGSDSHTPTGGAVGAFAMGAGGLDVALAMAGEPTWLKMPQVINVRLHGKMQPGVSAKDVILEMLRRETVKGGVGKVYEYTGDGVAHISIRDRSTITNMGAEMGATTSIFPSDEVTREFFIKENREQDWISLLPDEGCEYDGYIDIDLSKLEPLVAMPDMPDNVTEARNCRDVKINQVFLGSCTNASYTDFAKAAAIMDGKMTHPDVSFVVAPGSRQLYLMLLQDGIIGKLVSAGARMIECGCGACCGIGQAPSTDGVSLRTANRNFKGRGGHLNAKLYISSPEVAAASAITGYITDPRDMADVTMLETIVEPKNYIIDDRLILSPAEQGDNVEVIRGPNIKPMPINQPLPDTLSIKVSAVRGDNITTDDITPANAQFSALRSNIPEISKYCYGRIDPEFHDRCKALGNSIIIGGENYGQGSSREHAAIAPMYLGVKAIIAKSMARIHKNNLVNHGVTPLLFANPTDYDAFDMFDELLIENIHAGLRQKSLVVRNVTKNRDIPVVVDLTDREVEIIIAGGQLRYVASKNA
ncbi:aconitate hydratase [Metakosakonia massiliensis]|uniref:Homoaconitase large subunit n=1 Tax=Phytobacter massiliensis TaxID=1485952 RepID=A0A6N3E2Q2_9ENTR